MLGDIEMDNEHEKRNWYYIIMFAFLLYIITYVVVLKEMSEGGDYQVHASIANKINQETILEIILFENQYFMWHLFVRIVYNIFSMPIEHAAAVISSITNTIVYLIVVKIMSFYHVEKADLAGFLLLLVGPLYIPWYNSNIYLGQSSLNQWHNPTNLMVKPFAVGCFFMIVFLLEMIQRKEKVSKEQYILLAALLFFSVIAKPSFLQGIIPGLGIYFLFRCIKERFINFKYYFYICLTFVPAVCWMICIFVSSFYRGSGEGVGIGWLEVLLAHSPNVWISLLLLLGFPVLYIILNGKKIYKRIEIQLGICWEVMSWLEVALLYEKGSRKFHGNFGWASQLSAFVLWMVVLIHFVRDIQTMEMDNRKEVVKNSVLLVVLLLHLLCGCYYVFCIITIEGMWL